MFRQPRPVKHIDDAIYDQRAATGKKRRDLYELVVIPIRGAAPS